MFALLLSELRFYSLPPIVNYVLGKKHCVHKIVNVLNCRVKQNQNYYHKTIYLQLKQIFPRSF